MPPEAVKEGLSAEDVLPGRNIPQVHIIIFCIFQFSDMLLYANRAPGPGLQFRVHGQLSVADLQVAH